MTARGSTATGGMTTATSARRRGKAKATGDTTTHNNGKGQHGDMRHDDGDRRQHGNERHDDAAKRGQRAT